LTKGFKVSKNISPKIAMTSSASQIPKCLRNKISFLRSNKHSQNQSGFTLIEILVAIVVVSVLVVGIAPMLAITVATRVQSRRVDLATQAARAYVDGVRGGAVPIPQKFVKPLPVSRITDTDPFASAPLAVYPTTDPLRDPGVLVDTNNNGFSVSDPQDLVIQPLRNNGGDASSTQLDRLSKQGYEIVVRVYRADAFESGAPTKVTQTDSIFTSTNGARNYPLVVMRAQVVPSVGKNLDDLNFQIIAP